MIVVYLGLDCTCQARTIHMNAASDLQTMHRVGPPKHQIHAVLTKTLGPFCAYILAWSRPGDGKVCRGRPTARGVISAACLACGNICAQTQELKSVDYRVFVILCVACVMKHLVCQAV